ncbi:DNA cytosine methyltransferase [Streptomyces sp. NPDC023998]|uniref:DNA cytosine methyltransferase n=1 Tax=Streptomyces sp. NPDC023998 TaxID=3154597 RepID=UPI0033FCDF81
MASKNTHPFRIIDLFAGCGGFTQGFFEFSQEIAKDRGMHAFTPVAGVEIEAAAAFTYVMNFEKWASENRKKHKRIPEHQFFLGDIADWVRTDNIPKADVILGGPPCQGFSGLGKGDPSDARNFLWEQYFEVVKKAEPRIFIIENVDRFNSSEQITALKAAFKGIGYSLAEPQILNAADYGAAQRRMRTIIIGVRGKDQHIGYPEGDYHAPHKSDGLFSSPGKIGPWRTLHDCLRADTEVPLKVDGLDLPKVLADDRGVATVRISRKVKSLGVLTEEKILQLRENIPGPFESKQLHIGRQPTALSLARYKAIKPGQNRRALREADIANHGKKAMRLSTDSWDRHNNGSGDVMGRLEWTKPSVTIRTEFFKPEKGRYLHPDPTANRPLTHYEAALIQGFPRRFLWCGSKSQIARQIGNAVPVPLAKALARHVYDALLDGAGTAPAPSTAG